ALAMVRLKSNQPDLALLLLDEALNSLPPSSRLIREGTIMASYGAYPQALSIFEEAVKESPDSYDAQYNLAVVRLEYFKDAPAALAAAQRALEVQDTAELQYLLR